MFVPIGPGPVERDERATRPRTVRCERADQRAHRAAFELEHADRVGPGAAARTSSGRRAATSSMSGRVPVDCSMSSSVTSMTSRLRRPRKSIFSRPSSLDAVHLVLRDDRRFLDRHPGLGLALDREVLGERLAGDHDRGRVDAVLAAQPFEPARDVDRRAWRRGRRRRARAARPPSCSRRRTCPASRGTRAAACRGPSRAAASAWRSCRRPRTDSRAPRGVAHRGPRLDRRERDDLRDVVVAVPLRRVRIISPR